MTGNQRRVEDLLRTQGICPRARPGARVVRVDVVMMPLALLACAFVHVHRVNSVLRVSPRSSKGSVSSWC